jgi:orotate phosphoribosyltransferase
MGKKRQPLPGPVKDIRARLLELFKSKSLLIGDFTLASGMKSRYYFDGKRTTLDPEGAYLSARLILEELKSHGIEADAIGGLTLGADPLVAAVAAISFAERDQYKPLPALIVRKEPKKHGTQLYIEGFEGAPGSRVVIIDDVCTTGGSSIKAIRRVEETGYTVVAVICLLDREQGALQKLGKYRVLSLLRASELFG